MTTRVRRLRPHLLTMLALVAGIGASLLSFTMAGASVRHSDQLLLRQDAVQGSLLLGSYVGQTPPAIAALAADATSSGVDQGRWQAAAGPVVARGDYSALALLRVSGGRMAQAATAGTVHRAFGTPADAGVLLGMQRGGGVYSSAIAGPKGARWLDQFVGAPTVPAGFALLIESPLSDTPISLAALPGHPFSGIEAAIYVGSERAPDLVFSTTRHLPLAGERAVAVISGNDPFSSTTATLSTRVGSLSRPGGYILVMDAVGHLSGGASVLLPWALLVGGLLAAIIVACLLELSERRRRRALHSATLLAERNAELDEAMVNQARADARFVAMVRSSSDLTTVIDDDGTVRFQSPSSERLLAMEPHELVDRDFGELVHPDDAMAWHHALTSVVQRDGSEVGGRWRLRTALGTFVAVESRLTNLVHDPAVGGIVLNSRDVSDRLRLEEELRHQAFHDSLTGLANRALFRDRLEHALARLDRRGGALGVVFLDLDDFKAVNDGRGHGVGDELLHAVGERLRQTVRAGDTLARLGGDEFAVLVEESDDAGVEATGERILEALRPPVLAGGGETAVRASIGVTTTVDARMSAHDLLREADVAMYAAKSAGKGRCVMFHPGLHDQVIARLQLETELARALEHEELSLVYQPIVDLVTGEVRGMEALMRWQHPLRGVVMPSEFIPVAESTGLIVAMGRWLLRRACADAWRMRLDTGRADLHLAVNISAHQLDDADLVDDVAGALAESGLSAGALTLEITESAVMAHPDRSLAVLQQLKALGVRLSIDDFGTGYSSLSYLQRLPVDELKIDRTFVAADDETDESGTLVQTIVRLAEDFGLGTVAEGIETEAQRQRLQAVGCRLAQGFLFARPVELAELGEALRRAQRQPWASRAAAEAGRS